MVDYLMKHKGLSIGILVLCLIIVVVCLVLMQQQQEVTAKAEFEAIVLENGTQLLVEPAEGSSERNSSDQIVLHLPQPLESLQPGDRIIVGYDGEIAESYPAQIFNVAFIKRAPEAAETPETT